MIRTESKGKEGPPGLILGPPRFPGPHVEQQNRKEVNCFHCLFLLEWMICIKAFNVVNMRWSRQGGQRTAGLRTCSSAALTCSVNESRFICPLNGYTPPPSRAQMQSVTVVMGV